MSTITKYEKKLVWLIIVIMAAGFLADYALDGYCIRQQAKYEASICQK